jgi:hypothetical protein
MQVPTAIGVAAFGVAAVAFAARFVPITNRIVMAIVALAPYLMLGAPLSLVVFGVARHWIFAGGRADGGDSHGPTAAVCPEPRRSRREHPIRIGEPALWPRRSPCRRATRP